MEASGKMKKAYLLSLLIVVLSGFGNVVAQQNFRMTSNVDRRIGPRTTFQKPIAYDIADHTVLLEGALFSGGTYLFDAINTRGLVTDREDTPVGFYGGLFDLRIARKMSNALTYGFDSRLLVSGEEGQSARSEGRFDAYLRGRYGQISYGNFADRNSLLLSSSTILSGEANLFFDGYFDPSFERAFRYRGRFGSFLVDAAIDDDGDNYNAGFLYRSPTWSRKDSFSFDYHGANNYLGLYERDGFTAGYGTSYGSLDLKVAAAWDQFNPHSNFSTFERVAGTFCASYKYHAFTWSAGIMLAETNGGALETSYTAGMRYDMARGVSLNAGWFYVDSDSIGTDGNEVTAGDFSGVRTSISYRF